MLSGFLLGFAFYGIFKHFTSLHVEMWAQHGSCAICQKNYDFTVLKNSATMSYSNFSTPIALAVTQSNIRSHLVTRAEVKHSLAYWS